MLSSGNFLVLHFTFMSVVYLELIFVKGVKSMSRFILFHVDVQLFHHHLLIILSFRCCCCLYSFVKNRLTTFMWICFWAWVLSSVPLICLSIPLLLAIDMMVYIH